ncbi:hypothetical protein [Flavobacterium sp.]|uniref:hypothetical protein n=1 Tax=Flavobacterium sp. TaxID=239 RepID=UPI003D6AB232
MRHILVIISNLTHLTLFSMFGKVHSKYSFEKLEAEIALLEGTLLKESKSVDWKSSIHIIN